MKKNKKIVMTLVTLALIITTLTATIVTSYAKEKKVEKDAIQNTQVVQTEKKEPLLLDEERSYVNKTDASEEQTTAAKAAPKAERRSDARDLKVDKNAVKTTDYQKSVEKVISNEKEPTAVNPRPTSHKFIISSSTDEKPEEPTTTKPVRNVTVCGFVRMDFEKDVVEQTVKLENHILNDGICSMQFSLYLDTNANGKLDSADEKLSATKKALPGETITKVTLNHPLAEGEYKMLVLCQPFDLTTDAELNNMVLAVKTVVS